MSTNKEGPANGGNDPEDVLFRLVLGFTMICVLVGFVIFMVANSGNSGASESSISGDSVAMRVTIADWWWTWGLLLLGGGIAWRLWSINQVLIEISGKLSQQSPPATEQMPQPPPVDSQ